MLELVCMLFTELPSRLTVIEELHEREMRRILLHRLADGPVTFGGLEVCWLTDGIWFFL